MSKVSQGHRVAHRELDEQVGAAKAGVVEEVIGEEEPRLVVARFEDTGAHEAFDERELVDLGAAPLSEGPVILRPRHLLALARRRPVVLAMLFVAVAAAAIGVISLVYDWSLQAELGVAAVLVGLALLIVRRLQGQVEAPKEQDD